MPSLENDRLVFRFPQLDETASFSIDFQRTLRIPDTDQTYPLPPGLGAFPLRHVEDHAARLPAQTRQRGGVILPIWQAEAMWLNFDNDGPAWDLKFPVAVKIAAGKINAVSGETWRPGLHRDPQDYLVSPEQPWLDGFAIEPGVIRQFVAMPLGEGYTGEEQLSGEARWGGLQISVVPLKARVWQARRRAWEQTESMALRSMPAPCCEMGLAPGGRMHQEIHPDPFRLEDWDLDAAQRVFVTLVHAKDWKAVTGEAALDHPPTARDYAAAGLPWFDFYASDRKPLPGSCRLAGLASVAKLHEQKTGAALPGAQDVHIGTPVLLDPHRPRQVRTSAAWDC